MAEVKWIKLTTDMFDNRKVKHLRRLPDGNNIVLIWVMLLTMAGRCNSNGMIFLTENIPYTPKMLADELDFEENTVVLALKSLEQLNMIVTDGGFFTIAGWEEYQNIEGMDKIREQNRIRQQRRREKNKQALIGNEKTCEYCGNEGSTIDHIIPKTKGGKDTPENTVCSCLSCNMRKTNRPLEAFLNDLIVSNNDFEVSRILTNSKLMRHVVYDGEFFIPRNVTLQVTERHAIDKDIDKDIDIEEEIEKREKRETTTPQQIADLFNSICSSFPSVRSLSEARKKAIKARLNTYTLEDFRKCFEMAEASSFLKGSNDRNWTATFDWLIKDANMPKVLEGNYDDKAKATQGRKEIVPHWCSISADDAMKKADERTEKKVAALDDSYLERVEKLKRELGAKS